VTLKLKIRDYEFQLGKQLRGQQNIVKFLSAPYRKPERTAMLAQMKFFVYQEKRKSQKIATLFWMIAIVFQNVTQDFM
jgi:hypothetical protein